MYGAQYMWKETINSLKLCNHAPNFYWQLSDWLKKFIWSCEWCRKQISIIYLSPFSRHSADGLTDGRTDKVFPANTFSSLYNNDNAWEQGKHKSHAAVVSVFETWYELFCTFWWSHRTWVRDGYFIFEFLNQSKHVHTSESIWVNNSPLTRTVLWHRSSWERWVWGDFYTFWWAEPTRRHYCCHERTFSNHHQSRSWRDFGYFRDCSWS